MANDFLSGQQMSIPEKSIQLQLVQQGVIVAKDYHDAKNPVSIADMFKDAEPGTTAIIPITGAMTKYDVCGWYGMQSLAALVSAAAESPNISAIILKLDTPGGSADGSLDLAEAVSAAASVKPVIAYADGLLCSAGYRVASRATSIIAKPGSIIGSIGTMVTLRFNDEQLANAGIKEVMITADESADKNADYMQAKIGNYKLIKESILNPLNTQFKNEVTTARPQVDESALTGKTYASSEALKLNLIDSEGMLQDAIALAETTSKTNTSSMEKITFGQKIAAFLGLTSDADQLTEQHAQSLEQLATQNEQANQTIAQHEQTITNLQQQLDAVKALLPEQTDLVAAITELKDKAEKFDQQDGGQQHRLDKDEADGSDAHQKTPQQIIDELPHNKSAMESPFAQILN